MFWGITGAGSRLAGEQASHNYCQHLCLLEALRSILPLYRHHVEANSPQVILIESNRSLSDDKDARKYNSPGLSRQSKPLLCGLQPKGESQLPSSEYVRQRYNFQAVRQVILMLEPSGFYETIAYGTSPTYQFLLT